MRFNAGAATAGPAHRPHRARGTAGADPRPDQRLEIQLHPVRRGRSRPGDRPRPRRAAGGIPRAGPARAHEQPEDHPPWFRPDPGRSRCCERRRHRWCGPAHQCVRPYAHDTATGARSGAGLAVLAEEVDPPLVAFHPAGAGRRAWELADWRARRSRRVGRTGGVGDARVHDRVRKGVAVTAAERGRSRRAPLSASRCASEQQLIDVTRPGRVQVEGLIDRTRRITAFPRLLGDLVVRARGLNAVLGRLPGSQYRPDSRTRGRNAVGTRLPT